MVASKDPYLCYLLSTQSLPYVVQPDLTILAHMTTLVFASCCAVVVASSLSRRVASSLSRRVASCHVVVVAPLSLSSLSRRRRRRRHYRRVRVGNDTGGGVIARLRRRCRGVVDSKGQGQQIRTNEKQRGDARAQKTEGGRTRT